MSCAKETLLILLIITVALTNASLAGGKTGVGSISRAAGKDSLSEKRNQIFLHYGNLTGLGVGWSHAIKDQLRLEAALGIKSIVYVLLNPPFASNRINCDFRMNYYFGSWFYLSPGWYLGGFRLTEYVWVSTPKIAIGFEKGEKRSYGFEIGVAFNMPSKISTTTSLGGGSSISAEEERIRPSGSTFPFFTFRVRMKK
jgi:hypothetical protein